MVNERVYERNDSNENYTGSIGNEIGEIDHVYKKGEDFNNGVATKSPKDTKVYKPEKDDNTDLILVKVNDKIHRYIGKVEGYRGLGSDGVLTPSEPYPHLFRSLTALITHR